MIMQDFHDWLEKTGKGRPFTRDCDGELFAQYFDAKASNSSRPMNSTDNLLELISQLFYEMYETQVVIDGILDDLSPEII